MKIIYEAFKQSLLVIAGSILGVFAVYFQNNLFNNWKMVAPVVLILILVGSGLLDKIGLLCSTFIYKINKKTKKYAIIYPYEIQEGKTSSWVNISMKDIFELLAKNKIKHARINKIEEIYKFPIAINPYGGAYPENEFHKLEAFNKILDFVKNGGIFINIADIPFYYAHSELHGRNIDTTPFAGSFQLDRSFFETLLTQRLALFIVGLNEVGYPPRVFILNSSTTNMYSQTINTAFGKASPYVAVKYGLGYFVFSTLQINSDNKEKVPTIIKEAEKLL